MNQVETPPRNGKQRFNRLVHVLHLLISEVVLDIACGSGLWIIEAAQEWKVKTADILSILQHWSSTHLLCCVIGHHLHRV